MESALHPSRPQEQREQMGSRDSPWLSIAFTLAVIISFVAVVQKKYTNGLGLLAVFTLVLQFVTGPYLLVLPYAAKWRRPRSTD